MSVSATMSPPSESNGRPPRVRSVPPAARSVGPEAVELAASVGLAADGWQSAIMTDQMGVREDGKWAAFECGVCVPRQNGKGGIIEIRKLAGLYLLNERLIIYSAHQFKTAQEHFMRFKDIVRNSDELGKRVKKISEANGEEGIELWGQGRNRVTGTQRLLYLARSRGSGRGFTGDCNILDEAQYLTGKQIAALMPTMSALSVEGDPQVLMLGTPPDPAESADGGSYWISVRKRGHAGHGRICWHEYSPPEGFDRTDRQVWYDTNPALGIRISEEFVESELAALVAAGEATKFDAERLGDWPPDPGEGWSVVPQADWQLAYDPDSAVEDPICFAIATNMSRTWASIAIAGRRKDGLWHAEVIDRRPSVAWVVPRIAELLPKWRNCGVVLAGAGPAGALVADIEARNIEIIKASTQDFAKACGAVHVGLTGIQVSGEEDPRRIRHRCAKAHQKALDDAVKAAVKHQTGDVWTFDRDIDVDTSPLEAFSMALWGFAMFGQNAPNLPVTVSKDLQAAAGNFFRPQTRLQL